MADLAMGAVGLALAGITLPAQLFSSCAMAYTTISSIRSMGSSANTLYCLFKIQETRFLIWGQTWDVFGNGLDPSRVPAPIYEMILATLIQVSSLLDDTKTLVSRYGLQFRGEDFVAEPSLFRREIARQSTIIFRLQRSSSLLRKVRWVVIDQGRFNELIQQLSSFNDSLDQLKPLINRTFTATAVTSELLAQAIVDRVDIQQLRHTESLPVNSNLQELNDFSRAMSAASVRDQIEMSPLQWQPSHPLLEMQHINILPPGPNDKPALRSWARSTVVSPIHGQEASLVVEWRPYDQLRVRGASKVALQTRIEALVKMLQCKPRSASFRTLICVGFFEDNSNPRFGLVFRCPHEYVEPRDPGPMSLYQAISNYGRDTPYLGERFHLASMLTESLYTFHGSGWLHKSISSHNVLFFKKDLRDLTTRHQRPVSLENPYLTGFALSRPDEPAALSSLTGVERDVGLYRHPHVQGFNGATVGAYRAIYDIYSLGAVLLEIGNWLSLEQIYPNGMESVEFRNLLLDRYVPALGAAMGERYMIIVRKCLEGKFDGLHDFGENEIYSPDYSLNLQRCLLWEVVHILAECKA